jgi:glycosyltransferase involved in cell wall biosynthesis
MNVAYLCNSYPEPSESYVGEEIEALREHFVGVTAYSVRLPAIPDASAVYLLPLKLSMAIAATRLLLRRFNQIRDLVMRVIAGPEPITRRIRALAHTWLGAYFAVALRESRADHIHVHHGYFASWIGVVAARLLGISFSMTLHGSDLLVRADFLDVKLQACRFCFTISEFNRRYIRDRYPSVAPDKIFVQYLGVDPSFWKPQPTAVHDNSFHVVSVGRLHAIKNYAFLLLACRTLKSAGVDVQCTIAGEGPERPALQQLIGRLELRGEVTLAGHVRRADLPSLYARADIVVLTSHSEGIPVTLMEAMAMEQLVVAPAITGIPELVLEGKTGFLYQPRSMEDLLIQLQLVMRGGELLNRMKRAARQHILHNFNSRTNLARFAQTFLSQTNVEQQSTTAHVQEQAHEDPVLQQI